MLLRLLVVLNVVYQYNPANWVAVDVLPADPPAQIECVVGDEVTLCLDASGEAAWDYMRITVAYNNCVKFIEARGYYCGVNKMQDTGNTVQLGITGDNTKDILICLRFKVVGTGEYTPYISYSRVYKDGVSVTHKREFPTKVVVK